jgi:hypothetical protein
MEVSGHLHAPAALPPASTEYEAGWNPGPIWAFWKEKSFPLCREFLKIFTLFTKHNVPLEPWMVQSVVWSLCKLRYPGSRKRTLTLFSKTYFKKLMYNKGLPQPLLCSYDHCWLLNVHVRKCVRNVTALRRSALSCPAKYLATRMTSIVFTYRI